MEGQGLVFISPRNGVAKLCLQAYLKSCVATDHIIEKECNLGG
jgi:hypothetical protein